MSRRAPRIEYFYDHDTEEVRFYPQGEEAGAPCLSIPRSALMGLGFDLIDAARALEAGFGGVITLGGHLEIEDCDPVSCEGWFGNLIES